jgi:ribonuclease HI
MPLFKDDMIDANHIEVYTDGSCDPSVRIGCWAAIILKSGVRKDISGVVTETTHQRMELTSVIESIKTVLDYSTQPVPIVIFSDSQYVVSLVERHLSLRHKELKTKKGTLISNADLVETILEYIETLPITFIKVKAHQKETGSVNYNREVDKLCRKLLRAHLH